MLMVFYGTWFQDNCNYQTIHVRETMMIKKAVKRVVMALAATGLLSGLLIATMSAPASASTIQNGYLQICAQGSYPAFVHVNHVDLGGGMTTRDYYSTIQYPGQCWWSPIDTAGQWAQVDVVGIHQNGQEFYIGSKWFNSSASGMGLGAEGSEWSPWIQQW